MPRLLSFLLMIMSGGDHWHQPLDIEFFQAENHLLKERLRELLQIPRILLCFQGKARREYFAADW